MEEPPAEQSTDRPVSKRKRLEERHQRNRNRGQAPPSAYSRRDGDEPRPGSHRPAPPRSPSPLLPPRSPTPEAPARQRKRPGGGARMGLVDRETLRRRQEARERAEEEDAMRNSQSRGVTDIVRQHYNAVPQRGREWRKTESKIKGLRSFNNWVKSTLIQKFSPDEDFTTRTVGSKDWADGTGPPPAEERRLLVIDLGCGKGGDLGKWQQAPQPVDLYVGLDPADVSVIQARERYASMRSGRGPRQRRGPLFHGEFRTKDCFGEWLGEVDIVQQVGIDPNAGPGGSVMSSRWGGGGFDVVASMFAIHYAFESEEKTRQMLRNVAGALKKGGRFIGVCPNSDVISARVAEVNAKRKGREPPKKDAEPEDGEVEEEEAKVEWGNSIYRVRFPGETPEDGIFRPPFGWKYSYFMEEAVGEIPEYVVPWEAFRALTEEYNLELQYRKPFLEVWRDEKDDVELGPLSERMGVRDRNTGELMMTQEEQEAVSFYHAFCFYKTHLHHAQEKLTDAAGEVNERLTEARERVRKRKERKRQIQSDNGDDDAEGGGGDVEENGGAEEDDEGVIALENAVKEVTGRLDTAMRGNIDAEVRFQSVGQVLGAIEREIGEKMQVLRRSRRNRDDEEEEHEEEEEEDGMPPLVELVEERLEGKGGEWGGLSLTDRYSTNNAYVGFYRIIHEAKYPGDDIPPLPHASTWFAHLENSSRTTSSTSTVQQPSANISTYTPSIHTNTSDSANSARLLTRPATRTNPNPQPLNPSSAAPDNNADDSDDDIAIERERISLKCPLTLLPFTSPVTSTKCPHSFEREAIFSMIAGSSTTVPDPNASMASGSSRGSRRPPRVKSVRCPVCEVMLTETDLRSDPVLLRRVKRAEAAQRREAEGDVEEGYDDSASAGKRKRGGGRRGSGISLESDHSEEEDVGGGEVRGGVGEPVGVELVGVGRVAVLGVG
ncbi:hypothetical protein BO70DRAFT_293938 [Aspergillus heteromorphus CBS 117.55]|uniref:mRNA cap guanine-N(7) methyltransferase n=1 Tax=Aspergillus heteromorphus CBS 117.55 TaxID=1448321 RepID=A0A317VY95_9EURO|nr:uncharacterized protein BO70DRAFT_293938 [Aspergillus heteromorphus CBS 117.55]PWY78301.1 hypothetical protein BO70DRAFT_293938 [Aspergillus heteromorphus CBS 117.55]